MKIKFYSTLLVILLFFFNSEIIEANIENKIVVKVGNDIITSIDVENEIRTILFLSGKKLSQEGINMSKDLAIKSLIRKKIKNSEIKKYKQEDYNKKMLQDYLDNIATQFGINSMNLKKYLGRNNISYDALRENYEVELKWERLIFQLYGNKMNINVVDLENELQNLLNEQKQIKEFKLSEIQIDYNQESQKKLNEALSSIKEIGFGKTARKLSSSSTSLNNGNLGWISENVLSPEYLNILKDLNKGDISDPLKVTNSFIILKIDDLKLTSNDKINAKELEKKIINQKKSEKMNLYSRSHFLNLENSIIIDWK